MTAQEALLLAGALVGPGTNPDAPVEPVRARRYRHPALGGRTVVRLAAETAAVGEDGALAFLGFQPPEASEPLAQALRRGLGFPQWVLVNDPARAGEALAVAKEMERAAQLAGTKPGNAKQLYQALARRLPHGHLPSYWEQAGRAFLASDRPRYAAMMFEKAREAERVYALPVQQADHREVFLEFAFAGALPAKSLASGLAELQRRYPPQEAYETFVELALRRTSAGLPPWTGLPEQARQLSRRAGRDTAAEAERLLGALLDLPATRLAQAGFWRNSRAPLIRMARASAAVRGTLLNLFPEPGRGSAGDFDGWWLDLLDQAGALDALILPADQVAPESAPSRGAAGWLSHFYRHTQRGWQRRPPPAQLLALVARMAPRLRAEARAVTLTSGRRSHPLDANVLDVLVEHNIPLADPPPHASIDLSEWLHSDTDGGVRRPLEHVTDDPRFRPLLDAAIPEFCRCTWQPVDALLLSRPLQRLVRRWLEDQATALGRGALLQAARGLSELTSSTGPRTLGHFPKARGALASTGLQGVLARTLRAGLVDELGWPALEDAVAELEATGSPLWWTASWPLLVVHNLVRAIAVGPGGRVAEHELRLANPSPYHQPSLLYAGGQFLVRWYDRARSQYVAYWSGEPSETFPSAEPPWRGGGGPLHGFAFLLPDGGRVTGGRALYPGDRTLPDEATHLLWDGGTFWAVEWERDQAVLRELDPRSGERGRRSLPSFLEDRAAPGETLLVGLCSLAPLPAGLDGTPLGQRDGLAGFRVACVERADGDVVRVEGIDGRRLEGPRRSWTWPLALVELPGARTPRLLADFRSVELWDPDLPGPVAEVEVGYTGSSNRSAWRLPAAGTPLGVPPAFWHCLSVRDEPGSRALREVDVQAVAELLHAAREDLDRHEPQTPLRMSRVAAAVERLLPQVTHPLLLRGLLGTVGSAAQLEWRREKLSAGGAAQTPRRTPLPGHAAAPAPAPPPLVAPAPPDDPPLDEEALLSALADLGAGASGGGHRYHDPLGSALGGQLRLLGRFFAGEVDAEAVRPALHAPPLAWPALLGRIGGVAFRAVSPLVSRREHQALLELLELWSCLPFAADPESFRVGRAAGGAGTAGRSPRGAWAVLSYRMRGITGGWPSEGGIFIERRAGDGEATCLPAEVPVTEVRAVEAGWGTPQQLAAFVALARERRRLPWDPAVPEALATRTGLTRAEATLLWAGLPNLDTWHSAFLSPELRGILGLKAGEANAARATLRRATPERRCQLLHAAMPENPAELWRPLGAGPDDASSPLARLAAAWTGLFGPRVRPPEDALVEAASLGLPTPAGELLALLMDPATVPALTRDRDWYLPAGEHSYHSELTAGDAGAESMSQLIDDLAVTIPWAFASRPVGDPLRARLPELLALVLDRLGHPGLLLAAGWRHIERPAETAARLFGPAPYTVKSGVAPAGSTDDGLTVAVPVGNWSLSLYFRPALLGGDARSQLLRGWAGHGWSGAWSGGTVVAVDLLRSPGYAAMAERVRATPLPEGGFEANPAMSAPALVRAVAGAFALGDQAAALYLQLLALPEPTDQSVRRWNGWTAARHRSAGAELLAAGLVVTGSRQRAGRGLFLPGEWVPAAAPNRPVEAWKLPLYRLERDPTSGRPRGPLGRFLPLVPLHELFAAAWARVEAGDRPQGGAA